MSHPSEIQKEFFDKIIDAPRVGTGEALEAEKVVEKGKVVPIPNESTVLVLKHPCGPSVNVRGPFKLTRYEFNRQDGKAISETVVDAKWAGEPESDAHLHLSNWELVRYAKLEEANSEVKLNIKHDWKLSLLNAAKEPLFWFYLENDKHRTFVAYVSKYGRDPRKKPKPSTLVDLVSGLPE